ncbi:MAG: DUF4434 domain-containing protein [Gammaproteobacteria bacterium]
MAPSTSAVHLAGTFLQLQEAHKDWRMEDWARLFAYFRELRLSQLVIQWTAYDDISFYTAAGSHRAGESSLDIILKLADQADMQVLVGLVYDWRFWEQISRAPPLVEDYLRRSQRRSVSVASKLSPIVRGHPSFQGWYLTEEIDDINWRNAEARQVLFKYLREISAKLHEITPHRKVALSGFCNGHIEPRAFESFWSALLKAASIDIVFFQDGIGTEKLQLGQLPLYLSAMRKAVKAHRRDLQIVIEIFRQVAGPPIDNKHFNAVPGPLVRIRRQMAAAAPYASQLIGFSIPEYMTPLGGLDAGRLYESYRSERRSPP